MTVLPSLKSTVDTNFFFENNAGELRVIVLSVKENNQERLQSLMATTANQKISHHTYYETTTTTGRI
jgi:hypothetical protein